MCTESQIMNFSWLILKFTRWKIKAQGKIQISLKLSNYKGYILKNFLYEKFVVVQALAILP